MIMSASFCNKVNTHAFLSDRKNEHRMNTRKSSSSRQQNLKHKRLTSSLDINPYLWAKEPITWFLFSFINIHFRIIKKFHENNVLGVLLYHLDIAIKDPLFHGNGDYNFNEELNSATLKLILNCIAFQTVATLTVASLFVQLDWKESARINNQTVMKMKTGSALSKLYCRQKTISLLMCMWSMSLNWVQRSRNTSFNSNNHKNFVFISQKSSDQKFAKTTIESKLFSIFRSALAFKIKYEKNDRVSNRKAGQGYW